MALYLGSSGELKIFLNGIAYKLNIYSPTLTTNGVRLLSSDNYILKDSNGTYLTIDEASLSSIETGNI